MSERLIQAIREREARKAPAPKIEPAPTLRRTRRRRPAQEKPSHIEWQAEDGG